MKTSGKLGLATIFATLGLMGAFWPSMVSEELQQGGATNLALFFCAHGGCRSVVFGRVLWLCG